jgi:Tol biopolymer transport system component
VYVRLVGSEALLRLTYSKSGALGAMWSPDGDEIAFIRWDGKNDARTAAS